MLSESMKSKQFRQWTDWFSSRFHQFLDSRRKTADEIMTSVIVIIIAVHLHDITQQSVSIYTDLGTNTETVHTVTSLTCNIWLQFL